MSISKTIDVFCDDCGECAACVAYVEAACAGAAAYRAEEVCRHGSRRGYGCAACFFAIQGGTLAAPVAFRSRNEWSRDGVTFVDVEVRLWD